jgi:hypothetical protein
MVAPDVVIEDAATDEMTGGVVSGSVIVTEALLDVEMFPAPSFAQA